MDAQKVSRKKINPCRDMRDDLANKESWVTGDVQLLQYIKVW